MLTVDLQDFPLAYSPKLPARTGSLSRLINFSTLDQSIPQGHQSSPQSCQLHLGRIGRSSHIILITTHPHPSRDVLSHSAGGQSLKSTRLHAMVVVWSLLIIFFFGLLLNKKQIMKRTKLWRPWVGRDRGSTGIYLYWFHGLAHRTHAATTITTSHLALFALHLTISAHAPYTWEHTYLPPTKLLL